MKVRELIERLLQLDQNKEIEVECETEEDGDLTSIGGPILSVRDDKDVVVLWR